MRARVAETLLPLVADGGDQVAIEAANASLAAFDQLFQDASVAGLRRRLGLSLPLDGDTDPRNQPCLRTSPEQGRKLHVTFRALSKAAGDESQDADVHMLFANPAAWDKSTKRWHERLWHEGRIDRRRRALMRAKNPNDIPARSPHRGGDG